MHVAVSEAKYGHISVHVYVLCEHATPLTAFIVLQILEVVVVAVVVFMCKYNNNSHHRHALAMVDKWWKCVEWRNEYIAALCNT